MSGRERYPDAVVVGAVALAVAATLALSATDVAAQAAQGGSSVQSYTFDDPETVGLEHFRLITVPWSAAVPLGARLTVGVGGAYASGRVTGPDGGSVELSGVTDTDVGVSVLFGDWLVMSFDATVPTGRSTLSTEESVVAGVVAAELLPFSIQTWGSGSSAGGSVAVARQLGAWGFGLAAGYRVANEFEPLPGEAFTYNPGDQLEARVALDRDVLGSSTLSLVVGYQRYTDDQLLGLNLFRSGSRIQTTASLAFPVGVRSSGILYGGVHHRSQGALLTDESFLAGAADSPAQQLFVAGSTWRTPIARGAALLPAGEIRVFRAEDGASQGWIGSVGSALEWRLAGNSASTRLVLVPMGVLRLGNVVVEEGAESRFTGWEAGITLRVESGR